MKQCENNNKQKKKPGWHNYNNGKKLIKMRLIRLTTHAGLDRDKATDADCQQK